MITKVGIGGSEAQQRGNQRYHHTDDQAVVEGLPDLRVGGNRFVPAQTEATQGQGWEAVDVEGKHEAANDRREDEQEHQDDEAAQHEVDDTMFVHARLL